ncbi:signal peptidase II [Synechococcus sp. M16CYN]|uniref:signal peptidase II n=1 Tax=Synechococcus sp. M16CYN TaxID=3103139 RepID=UPI003246848F
MLHRSIILLIAAAIVLVDQISKAAISGLLLNGKAMILLPGLLSLQLVRNTGAAFSLLSGSAKFLGLLSLVVSLGALVWVWRRRAAPIWQAAAVACLLGGTLGNGLDRWRFGYVVDFLALIPVSFPVFNVADIAINLAMLCFAIHFWISRHDASYRRS